MKSLVPYIEKKNSGLTYQKQSHGDSDFSECPGCGGHAVEIVRDACSNRHTVTCHRPTSSRRESTGLCYGVVQPEARTAAAWPGNGRPASDRDSDFAAMQARDRILRWQCGPELSPVASLSGDFKLISLDSQRHLPLLGPPEGLCSSGRARAVH